MDDNAKWTLHYRSEKEICYGSGPEGAHNKILLFGPDREVNARLFVNAGELVEAAMEYRRLQGDRHCVSGHALDAILARIDGWESLATLAKIKGAK